MSGADIRSIPDPPGTLFRGKYEIGEGEELFINVFIQGNNIAFAIGKTILGCDKSLLMKYNLDALIRQIILEFRSGNASEQPKVVSTPTENINDNKVLSAPGEVDA